MAEITFSRDVTAAAATTSAADTTRQLTIDASNLLSPSAAGPRPPQFTLEQAGKITAQAAERFVQDNRDLLFVIDRDTSGKTAELLEQRSVATRADLTNLIAESAAAQTVQTGGDPLDADFFRGHSQLAALVVMNTGGIRDLLNSNASARAVVAQDVPHPEAQGYDALAQKAAALFAADSTLHDEDFFRENPKVGEFLLARPDIVQNLTTSSDASSQTDQFKRYALSEAYQDMFDAFLGQAAEDAVHSASYTDEYFSEHTDIAEYVVAGTQSTDVPSPADVLRKHPEFRLENLATGDRFNLTAVAKQVTAEQATARIRGSAATTEFFRAHTGVAQLVVASDQLRDGWRRADARQQLAVMSGEREASVSDATRQRVRRQFQSPFPELRAVTVRT